MTPEQAKALQFAAKLNNPDWRTEAVMLIAANNADGLVVLRSKVFNTQWGPTTNGADWEHLRWACLALNGEPTP